MKRKISLTIGLIILFQYSFAQDFYSQFKKSFSNKDTLQEWQILQKWNKANPKNPELFTCYFNYYFNKSRKEILILSSGMPPRGKKSLQLTDKKGNYAGYIGNKINYDNSYLKKGLDKINEGIKLYPNRLDMRFGKIYVLGLIKDWKDFKDEIIKTIDYSAKNKNQWTWTLNKKRSGGKDFFLSSIQNYQVQLYNTGDDKLIPYMQDIAKEVLKFYPNDINNLSNLAAGYIITKQYDKALIYLLKAVKIQPSDYIDLQNIAYAYEQKGNKEKAIEYYEKVLKYGDQEAILKANQALKELKK